MKLAPRHSIARLVVGALGILACNGLIGAGAPNLVDGFGGARGQDCVERNCAGSAVSLDPASSAGSAGSADDGGSSGPLAGGDSGGSGPDSGGSGPDSGGSGPDSRGSGPNACGAADGVCPAGCSDALDRDCPKEPGEACGPKDECRTGVCGREGVCCNSACTNGCYSCKVPGSKGTCSALDYSKSADLQNCGSCGAVCSTANIAAACTGGVCGGTCSEGFGNCSTQSNDGCETSTSADPLNCGACGVICKYKSCVASGCKSARVGPGPDGGVTFRIGLGPSLFAMSLGGIAAGKVAALGLLATVDGSNDKPVNAYLALYADVTGVPSTLVAQTELLTTTDALTAPTEGAINPPVSIAAGNYWLVLMVSNTVRLHAVEASFTTNWFHNTVPITFAKINGPLPGDLQAQTLGRALMYAVTTP